MKKYIKKSVTCRWSNLKCLWFAEIWKQWLNEIVDGKNFHFSQMSATQLRKSLLRKHSVSHVYTTFRLQFRQQRFPTFVKSRGTSVLIAEQKVKAEGSGALQLPLLLYFALWRKIHSEIQPFLFFFKSWLHFLK